MNSSVPPDLTVLTVVVEKHYDHLRSHIKLINRLNRGAAWRLVAIDNSSTGPSRLAFDDPRIEVRSGVAHDQTKPLDVRFSYHHADALNANLGDIRSRFLLVIDPDLFVVYPGWIRETTHYMRERKLSFFGVPWHPRWYTKYRGFPCVHFMMIDLQSVPVGRLDFRPELLERPSWSRRRQDPADVPRHRAHRTGWWFLDGIYRAFYPLLSRQLLGSSRDTGSKIWAEFGRNISYRTEIVVPVVDLNADFTEPKFLNTAWGRMLDRLMPRSLRFLPERTDYVRLAEAQEFAAPEFDQFASERFMWRGRPFAFHLRGHMNTSTGADQQDALTNALGRF